MEDYRYLMGAYTVTAPLAVIRDDQGIRHHVYDGAPVPTNADPADIARLLTEGSIALVGDAPEAPAGAATADVVKPSGNASHALWATYAVETGQTSAAEANDHSRDELRELYG